jgi:hypothetical protein
VQNFILRKYRDIPPDVKEGHERDINLWNFNGHSELDRDHMKHKMPNIRIYEIITKEKPKSSLKMEPLTWNRSSSAIIRGTISSHWSDSL